MYFLTSGSANVFGKESDSTILSIVSVATPQPCWYSAKAAKEKTERNRQGFVPIQLYKNRQRARFGLGEPSLLTFVLE